MRSRRLAAEAAGGISARLWCGGFEFLGALARDAPVVDVLIMYPVQQPLPKRSCARHGGGCALLPSPRPNCTMDITFDPLTEDAAAGFVLDEDDEAAAEAQQPPGDVLVTVRVACAHSGVRQPTESCVCVCWEPVQLMPATRAAFPADVHAPVLVSSGLHSSR